MPVRSWVLPGDTADVTTVQRIKEVLRQIRLRRALFGKRRLVGLCETPDQDADAGRPLVNYGVVSTLLLSQEIYRTRLTAFPSRINDMPLAMCQGYPWELNNSACSS